MTHIDIERLREIAKVEFPDIVIETIIPDINELRIIFNDGSLMDVWYSLKLVDRYSYHWERRAIDGTIYRHAMRHINVGNLSRASRDIFTMGMKLK